MLAANELYAKNFGQKGLLTSKPAKRIAILTCMDARLDPAKMVGLSEGDAHVIRNAGGRASDDAIRSFIISYKLAGTKEWFVIHHTECAMETFTNERMRELLVSDLETERTNERVEDVFSEEGTRAVQSIDFLPIGNLFQSVTEDVEKIRNHPLVPKTIPIYGFIYDVKSGRLMEVPEAMEVGKVKI